MHHELNSSICRPTSSCSQSSSHSVQLQHSKNSHTGAHFVIDSFPAQSKNTCNPHASPHPVERQLPSQKPKIPVTSGQTTLPHPPILSSCHSGSFFFSPRMGFLVVFTKNVHRPVALPSSQSGQPCLTIPADVFGYLQLPPTPTFVRLCR